ncbi:hypothetical protein ZWY2020_005251 [Hordeum vulgare]|nr:hypothetical protein ZWY2020_005251 [Hordeum vulgare]
MDNPSMAADGGVPCACVLGKEEGLSSSEPKFRSPNPSTMDRGGRSEKSGDGCGRCCLGFLLKLLTFLQAFATLSVVLYAASILFACAVMAAGLLYCAIFLAGYVAAEVSSGCCVCFVRTTTSHTHLFRSPKGKVHGGRLSFGVFHWTAPLLPVTLFGIGTVSSSPSSAPCLLSPVALMILMAFEPRSWCGSMAIVPWLSG